MTAPLFVSETFDAIVTKMQSLSFSPKIVQEHDFSFYAENPDALAAELPGIWIKPEGPIPLETGATNVVLGTPHSDIGRFDVAAFLQVRVVHAYEWLHGNDYLDQKIRRAEEIAIAFIGASAPAGFDLGIAGTSIDKAYPTGLDLDPAEQSFASQTAHSRVAVVAVTAMTVVRAQRT